MDKLADAVGLDPVEIRARNGMREGDGTITGQVIDSAAPVAELLQHRCATCRCRPSAPARRASTCVDARRGLEHHARRGRRARRRLRRRPTRTSASPRASTTTRPPGCGWRSIGGEPVVTVHTAAAEVGQGLITVEQQICRTELGVDRVVVAPKDTQVGSGGSTSASRQTYVTGGAVKAACENVRASVLELAGELLDRPSSAGPGSGWTATRSSSDDGRGARRPRRRSSATAPSRRPSSGGTGRRTRSTRRPGRATRTCSTRSPRTARSSTSTSSSGLVKVVALDTAQDVGKAINPDAVVGQIQGGSAQGMGLALMEEILVATGRSATRRSPTT